MTGFGPYPFLVIRNLSPKEKSAIAEELAKEKYDLIHAETFYVMPHIPTTKIPILLVEQTIEYLVYKHYVQSIKNPLLRLILNIDVAKLKYWEKAFWKKADRVVAVSEADKKEMLKLEPKLNVGLVPNGVNLDFFEQKTNWSSQHPAILFVANFKWLQNIEAAELLLENIFPQIQTRLPQAKLWIVGQHIPPEIINRKSKKIVIDKLKEDDEDGIKKAYFQASLFLSPLRGPGGTRLKHFAAMAAKLPLVTTLVGAEGLGARNGKELVIEDEPTKLAESAVEVLLNPQKAKYLAENARKLVEEKFSWFKMSQFLDKIYQETAYGK
jgi:glycosyltransferase involved in cell wall biosynthesis